MRRRLEGPRGRTDARRIESTGASSTTRWSPSSPSWPAATSTPTTSTGSSAASSRRADFAAGAMLPPARPGRCGACGPCVPASSPLRRDGVGGAGRQVLDADRNGIGRASRLFSHCAAVEPARHRRSSTADCDSPDCAALPHTPAAHMRVVLPDAFPAAFLFFDQKMAAHAGRSSMRTAAGAWTGASSASRYASWCLQALVW